MKKCFLTLIICLFCLKPSYAFDWKSLHEEADKINFAQAERMVHSDNSAGNQYLFALVCLNLHKDKEAGLAFDNLLKIEPDNLSAQWGRAEVLRRMHNIAESKNILNSVLKIDPDFAPALNTLAYINYLEMNFTQAVQLTTRVVRLGQDKVDASNLARAYTLLGGSRGMLAHYGGPFSKLIDGTQVLPNLKKAESISPESAAVKMGLGSFYFLAPVAVGGDLDKAVKYLEEAVKIDPLFCEAYVRLAQAYKFKGDNAKYEEYLTKALEIDPQNEIALDIKNGKCKFICTRGF